MPAEAVPSFTDPYWISRQIDDGTDRAVTDADPPACAGGWSGYESPRGPHVHPSSRPAALAVEHRHAMIIEASPARLARAATQWRRPARRHLGSARSHHVLSPDRLPCRCLARLLPAR